MDYLFREEDFLDPFAVQKRLFDDNADVDKNSMKLLVSEKKKKKNVGSYVLRYDKRILTYICR